mgnify:CR=1 FL=1
MSPHTETIILALQVALGGIRRSGGFNNDTGRVQRFSDYQQIVDKPTILLQGSRESLTLVGAGYDATFSIEIQAYFYHANNSNKSLDEVSNLWRHDVHRAIAKMDWQTLQVDAVDLETVPFQLEDQTSLHDGNVTQLTCTYRLEDGELNSLI